MNKLQRLRFLGARQDSPSNSNIIAPTTCGALQKSRVVHGKTGGLSILRLGPSTRLSRYGGCLVLRQPNNVASLAARGESPPSHRDRRGARLTRREEGEYREYSTDEQRSQPGCRVGRMQGDFCHGLLGRSPPKALFRLFVENLVGRNEFHVLQHGLSKQDSVPWIAMVPVQVRRVQQVPRRKAHFAET